jgi:hypothetical protein
LAHAREEPSIGRLRLTLPDQYYDAETALNYNYFRDHDPNTGRILRVIRSGCVEESTPMHMLVEVPCHTSTHPDFITRYRLAGSGGWIRDRARPKEAARPVSSLSAIALGSVPIFQDFVQDAARSDAKRQKSVSKRTQQLQVPLTWSSSRPPPVLPTVLSARVSQSRQDSAPSWVGAPCEDFVGDPEFTHVFRKAHGVWAQKQETRPSGGQFSPTRARRARPLPRPRRQRQMTGGG